MSCDGQDLAASFLAGDLDEVAAAAFEAHLLICDECWAALEEDRVGRAAAEQVRELAPPGLSDRIAMEISVSQGGNHPRQRSRGRLAGVVVLAVVSFVALMAGLATRSHPPPGDPTPIAQAVAAATAKDGTTMGHLSTVTFDGARVVVAFSATPFPMASGAVPMTRANDPWVARRDTVNLVCLTLPHPVLLASTLPVDLLVALAYRVETRPLPTALTPLETHTP